MLRRSPITASSRLLSSSSLCFFSTIRRFQPATNNKQNIQRFFSNSSSTLSTQFRFNSAATTAQTPDNVDAWIPQQSSNEIRSVTYEQLADLGVWVFKMDPKTMLVPSEDGKTPSRLEMISKKMNFTRSEEIKNDPETVKACATEHIHEHDEIRLIMDGSGYFDVRNLSDEWVRILCRPGDLILIPAGIYHRFTMDTNNYTHAIRLFSELPKWTPVNRPCEENPFRIKYLETYARPGGPVRSTVLGKPPNNVDDFYIHYPATFDEVVKPLMRKVSESQGKDMLVIYYRGENLPRVGFSWCGDCMKTGKFVQREIEKVRAQFAAEGGQRKLYYVEANVNRAAYLNNPDYLYRKHPFIHLTGGVPTLQVLAGQEDEGFERQRLDGDIPESFNIVV